MLTSFRPFFRSLIGRLIGVSASTIDETARSTVIKKLFSRCPVCRKSLDEHSHWKLASAILDMSAGNADRLAGYIANKQWSDAAQINEWAHDKNVREYHIIRCPNDTRLGLIAGVFTHEMLSSDFVESTETPTEEDSREVLNLVGDRWITL